MVATGAAIGVPPPPPPPQALRVAAATMLPRRVVRKEVDCMEYLSKRARLIGAERTITFHAATF
jgi:hypothetical protein